MARTWWGWWRRRPVVPVVRLSGVIGSGSPLRGGLTLDGVAPLLDRAFAPARLAAVALMVNSPGGAPVQSALICQRIRQLAEEKKVKVLAFVEDVAASGGYWLACAADEIYADENSVVGSIGVISSGFGFHQFLTRHGIERRLYTAGPRKSLLDPFLAERAEDVERLAALQAEIHASFKALVRTRRGDRLQGSDEALFSGEFWTGRGALALGLIDGLGEARTVLRARFGERVRLRRIDEGRGWLARHVGMARGGASPMTSSWAAAATAGVLAAAEDRAQWARYGV